MRSAPQCIGPQNVYSLNAVGYINVTMPPGFSIVTCPLICSPDNTIATLFPNGPSTAGAYQYCNVVTYSPVSGFGIPDAGVQGANAAGWNRGGTETINPGQAVFFYNYNSTPITATFVGTVPTGSLTNQLAVGYNLVGSIVPVSGNYQTNSIAADFGPGGAQGGDNLTTFSSTGYSVPNTVPVVSPGTWSLGGPNISNVYEGFFYYNANYNSQGTENWVESFSIN